MRSLLAFTVVGATSASASDWCSDGGVDVTIVVPRVGAAWAKARGRDGIHPLVCHVLDTAAVAERLWLTMLGPAVRHEILAGLQPLGAVVE